MKKIKYIFERLSISSFIPLFSMVLSVFAVGVSFNSSNQSFDAKKIVDTILASPEANTKLFMRNGELILLAGTQAAELAQKESYLNSIRHSLLDPPLHLTTAKRPSYGDGPAKIVIFTDIFCPKCGKFAQVIKLFLERPEADDNQIILKFLPAANGTPVQYSRWILAAVRIDPEKAFALVHKFFGLQADILKARTMEEHESLLKLAASAVGLHADAIHAVLFRDSSEIDNQLNEDFKDAARAGITGTPALVLDDRILAPGYLPLDVLLSIVQITSAGLILQE